MNDWLKWLGACGALAVGELIGAAHPTCSESWPALSLATLLIALVGFGLKLRGWHYLVLITFGMTLYFAASVAPERTLRECPWMRYQRPRRQPPNASVWTRLGANCSRRLALGMEHDPRAVAMSRALILGERRQLPFAIRRTFIESGTIHVFAISGLHVMIVAKVLMFFVLALGVGYRFAGIATLPFLWGYVFLIGAPPSAVRAAAMASLNFAAPLFYRRADSLRAWSLTFLSVYLVNPRLITDIGSALSFLVMLSLILALRFPIVPGRGLLSKIASATVAWSAGAPLAAMVFARVTPGGILANLLFFSAAAISVTAGVVGLIFSYCSDFLAAHCLNLAALSTNFMFAVASAVARLPYANLEISPLDAGECLEWYALVILVLYLLHSLAARRKRL